MASDPLTDMGSFLTATEAERLAVQIETGQHTIAALSTVSALRAITGAKSVLRELTPVWTMPGNEATTGRLTGEFHRIVRAARQSVTAATYNFHDSSQMSNALKAASEQPGMVVIVYVDADKADADNVKARLLGARNRPSEVALL